jgi:hypothetical protein
VPKSPRYVLEVRNGEADIRDTYTGRLLSWGEVVYLLNSLNESEERIARLIETAQRSQENPSC